MVKYPSMNIRVTPLDYKRKRNLGDVKSYLEINGESYHQNSDNPSRKEYHYFMGNSNVFIREFTNRADIRIIASAEAPLNRVKISIEKILNED